jgi:hypothetical protein
MIQTFRYVLLVLWLFLISQLEAQVNVQPQVSVLTCAPGNEIYSMYGHNALRLRYDDARDFVFNYGTFDFGTPNFTVKFMRGKLPYLLSVNQYNNFLYEYNATKRSVTEQILDLDSIQTNLLVSFLEENARPENREYKYDFFFDNCATRIYDVVQFATENKIIWAPIKDEITFRDIIKKYQKYFPWTDFGIDIIIGSKADKNASVAQEMFIPDFVEKHFETASLNGKNIVSSTNRVLTFEVKNYDPLKSFFVGPMFLFLLLTFAELFFFKEYFSQSLWLKRYDRFWFYVLSFIGILIMVMWLLTDHVPTKNNWNIMWTLPAVLFIFTSHKRSKILFIFFGILFTLTIVNSFGVQILPQYFHPAFGFIALISFFKIMRNFRTNNSGLQIN